MVNNKGSSQISSLTHQIHALPNGLRYIHQPMHDAASVTVQVFIGVGGRHEDLETEYGVSHFLEHLLFKGSVAYPSAAKISESIESVGGYTNAFTTEEVTSFFIKIPSRHFDRAVKVLGDIIRRPLFEAHEIERERLVILEEMHVLQDDPAQLVFDYLGDLLFPSSSLRTNVYGTPASAQALTREQIVAHHGRWYVPDNAVLVIAGDVIFDQAQAAAQSMFGDWAGSLQTIDLGQSGDLSSVRVHLEPRATNQAHILLAGRGVALAHPDQAAVQVLMSVLANRSGSRLEVRLREEKGLAYRIFMQSTGYSDTGKWQLYVGANGQRCAEAVESMLDVLAGVRDNSISERELEITKEQLKGRMAMSQEANSAVADRLGFEIAILGAVRDLDEQYALIDAVTAAELLRVAQAHLQPSGMRLAVIAPVEGIERAVLEDLLTK